MSEKKVLVSIHRAPHGTIFAAEGLRAAVGLTAGIDEHEVDVVYQGDGVYFTLRDVDRAETTRYLDTLKTKTSATIYVDGDALAARGLSKDDVADDIQVIGRAEVLDLFRAADVNLDL